MPLSSEAIAQSIGLVTELTDTERRAVLEIAYYAVVADQEISEGERTALRIIASQLFGAHDDVEVETRALLVRLDAASDREVQSARLRRIANLLSRPPARAVAYKTALTLARADAHASDGEFEFDLELIDALGLPQAEADLLAEQVTQALDNQKA